MIILLLTLKKKSSNGIESVKKMDNGRTGYREDNSKTIAVWKI